LTGSGTGNFNPFLGRGPRSGRDRPGCRDGPGAPAGRPPGSPGASVLGAGPHPGEVKSEMKGIFVTGGIHHGGI